MIYFDTARETFNHFPPFKQQYHCGMRFVAPHTPCNKADFDKIFRAATLLIMATPQFKIRSLHRMNHRMVKKFVELADTNHKHAILFGVSCCTRRFHVLFPVAVGRSIINIKVQFAQNMLLYIWLFTSIL